jgi:hypothetical protein
VGDRVEEPIERGPERVAAARLRRVLGPHDQIGAGAERLVAGTSDHDGAQVAFGFEVRQELRAQVDVQGVPAFRSVDGRDPDEVGGLPPDHEFSSRR